MYLRIVYKNTKIIVIALILPAFIACSHFRSRSDETCLVSFKDNKQESAQRVAILPFKNDTSEEDLGSIVRKSFYNNFSSKNFHDLEMAEIDSQLKELEVVFSKPWQQLSPTTVGSLINADYLIYGEVHNLTKNFWIFYSQEALSVNTWMVETKNGRRVWKKDVICRSHCGDIPLGPFGIIKTFIRARMNINDESTIALVDKTCKKLVEKIPNPQIALLPLRPVDIQLCSFKEKASALKIKEELCREGLNPKIVHAKVRNQNFFRVVIGPYTREEANKLEKKFYSDNRFSPLIINRKTSKT